MVPTNADLRYDPGMVSRRWTAKEERLVRRWIKAGKTHALIGQRLQRSRQAIKIEAMRLRGSGADERRRIRKPRPRG